MNCDFKFTTSDLDNLVVGLLSARPMNRLRVFQLLMVCHDKSSELWALDRLRPVFQAVSHEQYVKLEEKQKKIKEVLDAKYGSCANYFRALTKEKQISKSALMANLSSLLRESGVHPEDVEEIFLMQEPDVVTETVSVCHFLQILNRRIRKRSPQSDDKEPLL